MQRILLSVDKRTLNKINLAASLSNVTASVWVSRIIKHSLETRWTKNYFNLFGSIKDKTFKKSVTKS